MIELSIVERYVFSTLSGQFPLFRIEPAPFDAWRVNQDSGGEVLPIIFFQHFSSIDRNAIGPGPRLMTTVDYEIGIFHQGNSFGASVMDNNGTYIPLLSILDSIDDLFQNFGTVMNQPDGNIIHSSQRISPIRMKERGPDGRVYSRDGGIYRFTVKVGTP
jgi:hypothetical protein